LTVRRREAENRSVRTLVALLFVILAWLAPGSAMERDHGAPSVAPCLEQPGYPDAPHEAVLRAPASATSTSHIRLAALAPVAGTSAPHVVTRPAAARSAPRASLPPQFRRFPLLI
jgi:hypothetical protein